MDEGKQKQRTSIMSTVLQQGGRLLKTELELAGKDLKEDASRTAKGSLLMGLSAWLGFTGLSALVIAGALALPKRPVRGALYTGLGLMCGSLAVGLAGLGTLPKKPMGRAREGLKTMASTVEDTLTH